MKWSVGLLPGWITGSNDCSRQGVCVSASYARSVLLERQKERSLWLQTFPSVSRVVVALGNGTQLDKVVLHTECPGIDRLRPAQSPSQDLAAFLQWSSRAYENRGGSTLQATLCFILRQPAFVAPSDDPTAGILPFRACLIFEFTTFNPQMRF